MPESSETTDPNISPRTAATRPPSTLTNMRIMLPLGVLVLLLALVIFVLPAWVEKSGPIIPTDNQNPDAQISSQTTSQTKTTAPLESPWTDAQIAKERRETQDILAKLLNAQEQLQNQDVERWAEEEYASALTTAESGDAFYRERKFSEAKQRYNETLEQFKAIASQAQNVLEEQLLSGSQALENNNAELAIAAYTLALKIDSNRTEAQQGLERALALTDVLALLEQGQTLEQANNFDEAKQRYEQALEKDPASPLAQQYIQKINSKIVQRDFTELMSLGYLALEENNFDTALSNFQRAIKLKPNASEAAQALAQAKNQKQLASINSLLKKATQQEEQEQWANAIKSYQQVLTLDSNVVSAKIGEIRSSTRQELADNIAQIIDNPLRLQSNQSYRYAQSLLKDLKSISQPGPKAQAQIESLSNLLKLSRMPVAVNIKSDAQTHVTLYRVGELGLFNEHAIQLTPGKYTLVGKREGYRDVRKEFTIEAQEKPNQATIVIQCEEKISNS